MDPELFIDVTNAVAEANARAAQQIDELKAASKELVKRQREVKRELERKERDAAVARRRAVREGKAYLRDERAAIVRAGTFWV